MTDRFQTTLLVALLLVAGGFAWMLALRPTLRVDTAPLAALPLEIGEWYGRDVPLQAQEEAMLRADRNVQRLYQRLDGQRIWLFVSYYGTDRGGIPEHTPDLCYPANGWTIEREGVSVVDPATDLHANEYVASKGAYRELVFFWYRSYRKTGMLGWVAQTADRMTGRLSTGRADGALVRVSTPLEEGKEAQARERLEAFVNRLETLLGDHWPAESGEPAAS